MSRIGLCLIFLFVCATTFFLAAAIPVLDVNGDELQAGTRYYVNVTSDGEGRDLTLSIFKSPIECPTTITLEPLDVRRGIPIIFQNFDSEDATIHLSSSLNIEFEANISCAESTVWQYSNIDPRIRSPIVQIEGEQGCNFFNCFKIEKGFTDTNYFISSNEGIYLGARRSSAMSPVEVSDFVPPLEVVFVKVDQKINSIITTN